MARHELKIWPEHFQPVHDGIKRAEIRQDDRSPPFARHDELWLKEWEPCEGKEDIHGFTGRVVFVKVTHASRGVHVGVGKVLLSIEKTECNCCIR